MPQISRTITPIDDLQNNTKLPPLFVLGTTSMFSNCIFIFTSFNLVLSAHVSTINTTEKYFSCIMSASSFSIHRFPSPQQFQIKQLIAIGRTDTRPPPLNKKNFHRLLKPVYIYQVTPDNHPQFSCHKLFCLLCYSPQSLNELVFSVFLWYSGCCLR